MKIINVYPIKLKGHSIESPLEHMIKSIKYSLTNMDNYLDGNQDLSEWLAYMPTIDEVPNIREYQDNYKKDCPDLHTCGLDSDFKKITATMPLGQILFHSGRWLEQDKDECIFTMYTSTSLDPGAALGNTQDKDIYLVIKIMSPEIKFYFFNPEVGGFAEAEVLLEKGIKLIKKDSYKIKHSYNDSYVDVFCVEAYKID